MTAPTIVTERSLHQERDTSIDVARGIAIFVMLPANMSATSYAEPHPMWFRIFSSLAAPLFIFVAGMMVAFSGTRKHYHWSHFAVRGGLLMLTGATIDICIWRMVPFNSFDVLYLIGIITPLAFLFTKLPFKAQLAAIIVVFSLTPILQAFFGYTEVPSDTVLWGLNAGNVIVKPEHPTNPLNHLFIDGWFPLFPWAGVMWSGAFVAQRVLLQSMPAPYGKLRNLGAVLLLFGIPVWFLYPGAHYVRMGYSEMFYPPTAGFLISALGFNCITIWAAHIQGLAWLYRPLRWLGEAPLFFYIFHSVVIAFLINPYIIGKQFPTFSVVNLGALALLLLTGLLLCRIKQRWPKRPFIVRFLLGS